MTAGIENISVPSMFSRPEGEPIRSVVLGNLRLNYRGLARPSGQEIAAHIYPRHKTRGTVLSGKWLLQGKMDCSKALREGKCVQSSRMRPGWRTGEHRYRATVLVLSQASANAAGSYWLEPMSPISGVGPMSGRGDRRNITQRTRLLKLCRELIAAKARRKTRDQSNNGSA